MKSAIILLCILYVNILQSTSQVLVKDIWPGYNSSVSGNNSYRDFNGTLLFVAMENPSSGYQLWRSDGTSSGTKVVSDFIKVMGGPSPYPLWNDGVFSYWALNDSIHGYELWKTDGTSAGTSMIKDIYPGTSQGVRFFSGAKGGNKWFFAGIDSANGMELWSSDGTGAGTKLVKDISPGVKNVDPRNFASLGTKIVFVADSGNLGMEPWVSDGTPGGTWLLKDINPGYEGSVSIDGFTFYKNELYFSANKINSGFELWKTDGTTKGTVMVKDINSGFNGSDPGGFIVYKGRLFFGADDGSGYDLWSTDGTPNGTMITKHFGSGLGGHWLPNTVVIYNGLLFFPANDGIHGEELWSSDGTAANTKMAVDLLVKSLPFPKTSEIRYLTPAGGILYFSAYSDSIGSPKYLWQSDGTPANTTKLEVMDPIYLTPSGNTLFFNGYDVKTGRELWKVGLTNSGIDKKMVNQVKIYPNPCSKILSIYSNATTESYYQELNITDITGHSVYFENIVNDHCFPGFKMVNVSGFASGIYYVNLRGENGNYCNKLLIE